jgi:hypothetical protein
VYSYSLERCAISLSSRGFTACGIGPPSIQVPVTDYVTADDLYSVS